MAIFLLRFSQWILVLKLKKIQRPSSSDGLEAQITVRVLRISSFTYPIKANYFLFHLWYGRFV